MRNLIKHILKEEVNRKYSKPTEKIDKLVYGWLDNLFSGSQMYYTKSYETRHDFEWCNDGFEICKMIIFFETDDTQFDDKRLTNEREFDEADLWVPKDIINDLVEYVPIRRNYLRYLIEEWFEDNLLSVVHQKMERNDIYITEFSEYPEKTQVCVPPVEKSEDVSMEEMIDYVVANTLFRRETLLKKEEDEPGFIEKTYLSKLRQEMYGNLNESPTGDTINKQKYINKPVRLIGDVNINTVIQDININNDGSVNISFQNGMKINSSLPMLRRFDLGVNIPLEIKVRKKHGTSLNENTEKDLSKKLKLAKGLIYDFFGDEVSFIEQSIYDDKPLLKIYYTTDSQAANHDTWLAERISEVVMEYTGNNLILVPYYTFNSDIRRELVDIYISCEELKTDEDGNVLDEEETTEGAGGYAAPAFEMKPDHVHFKRLYNESENKKTGLLRAIEEDGLYQVIEDTGLTLEQIILKYDNLPREVFEGYIKDVIKEDGYHMANGDVELGFSIELSKDKVVQSFYLSGDEVTIEINEYGEYGMLVSGIVERLSSLSDEELHIIVDDITSWDEDSYYDI